MSDSIKNDSALPKNWSFVGGAPPGPQSASAGTRWEFRLPVAGEGDTPECHWSSSLLKDGMYGVSDDGLAIWVELPRNLRGVEKIHYHVKAEPPLDGFVMLKVLPPEAALPSERRGGAPASPSGKTGGRSETPAENSKGEPKAGDDHLANVLAGIPTGQSKDAPPDRASSPKAEMRTPPAGGPAPGQAPFASTSQNPPSEEKEESPALPSLPPGRYFVAVYRDNIPIPQLRRQIEPHRSLAVGKFSRSKNILPDLDLKPHFVSREMARRCSREQAKIFWKDGRILLKNTGKADIEIPGRMDLESEGIHFWEVGEALSLPGGLSVVLEKEA
jgi:hypothetical protein